MTYQVISILKISCDGPGCTGTGPRPSEVSLDVDEVVNSETIPDVVRRALEQLPQSDWFMVADFNATSRTRLQFFCSVACLMRGADVAP